MPPRARLLYASLSLAFFLVAGLPLYMDLSQRSDIWWTPHTMLVPLTDSSDRVEMYARGKPLTALLKAGQLRIAGDGGSSILATSDVGFRFNNWDRIRAERLPGLVMRAAACGVAAIMF